MSLTKQLDTEKTVEDKKISFSTYTSSDNPTKETVSAEMLGDGEKIEFQGKERLTVQIVTGEVPVGSKPFALINKADGKAGESRLVIFSGAKSDKDQSISYFVEDQRNSKNLYQVTITLTKDGEVKHFLSYGSLDKNGKFQVKVEETKDALGKKTKQPLTAEIGYMNTAPKHLSAVLDDKMAPFFNRGGLPQLQKDFSGTASYDKSTNSFSVETKTPLYEHYREEQKRISQRQAQNIDIRKALNEAAKEGLYDKDNSILKPTQTLAYRYNEKEGNVSLYLNEYDQKAKKWRSTTTPVCIIKVPEDATIDVQWLKGEIVNAAKKAINEGYKQNKLVFEDGLK